MSEKQTTLVIGLGNPILGDDGVGWRVAEEAEARLNGQVNTTEREIEFDYLSLGGLSLMERMNGYRDVVVVDSIVTRQRPIGSIFSLLLSSLPDFSAGHTTAIHDTSLATALDIGRKMGMELPEKVWVVAVEAEYVYDFSEELSPPVAAAVPKATEVLMEVLEMNREEKIYDLT
jgi:hydrogenase maturation protease